MSRWWLSVLVVLGLVACSRDRNQERLVFRMSPGVKFQLAVRVQAVLARPEVDRAFDTFIAGVAADPELAAIAGQLSDRLGSDPAIGPKLAELGNSLADDPEVQRQVQQLMADNPGMTAEQVGAAFGSRVEQAFDREAGPAMEAAGEQLFRRLEVDREVASMKAHLGARFGASLEAYFESPAHEGAWTQRLIAINGGKRPGPDEAAQLYFDHAWSEERMAKFVVAVMSAPTVQRELAGGLRRALSVPAVEEALVTAARDAVGDPELRRHASGLLLLLVQDRPDHAAIQEAIDGLFGSAAITGGASKIVKVLLTDPKVIAIVDEALPRLAKDPGVRKAIDELLDGW